MQNCGLSYTSWITRQQSAGWLEHQERVCWIMYVYDDAHMGIQHWVTCVSNFTLLCSISFQLLGETGVTALFCSFVAGYYFAGQYDCNFVLVVALNDSFVGVRGWAAPATSLVGSTEICHCGSDCLTHLLCTTKLHPAMMKNNTKPNLRRIMYEGAILRRIHLWNKGICKYRCIISIEACSLSTNE